MKHRHFINMAAVITVILVMPFVAYAWTGDPWGSISRQTITSIASKMIDSYWIPKNDINNFGYGTTWHKFTVQGGPYRGEAYSQCPIQDNWDEFFNYVNTTTGGDTYYGNDCSGFASISWRLPKRYTTRDFECDAINSTSTTCGAYYNPFTDDYVYSLGNIGSGAQVTLLQGDALNDDYNHIILFNRYTTGGMESMEQTPWTARREIWKWEDLYTYRPIRRNMIEADVQIGLTQGLWVYENDPSSYPIEYGQWLDAQFTVKNYGSQAVTFSKIGIGGRAPSSNGGNPDPNNVYDLGFDNNITLQPNEQRTFFYEKDSFGKNNIWGTYKLTAVYQLPDGTWHDIPPGEPGTGTSHEFQIVQHSTPSNLSNGVGKNNYVPRKGYDHFYIDLPSNASNLVIKTTEARNGDYIDLYEKAGSGYPTTSSYDHAAYTSSSNETITISNPSSGRHCILVYGYYSSGSEKGTPYKITATYEINLPPSAPTNVQATDGTYTDKVRITWSSSSGATSYEVYRATSSGGTKSQIGTPSGTSYDDTSASIGTTYYYWVKAKNTYGTSGYSSYNTGYRAGTAPPAPTNVQATDGTYTDKVRITWSASSGATSYEVYRATSSGGTKSKIGTPSGTSYDDTSASIGTTYYYWVKAKNSYGTSGYSSYNTGYRAGTAPSPPTNVQATDGTYTDKVRITWSASSGATSYEVYRATSSGGTKSKIGTPSGTSYDDTSASIGTTYYYWVKAKNSYGTSGYSSYNTGYRAGTAPSPPTNIQATDGTYTDKVRITWSASSGATSYEVYRATSSGGTKSKIGTPSGTSYDDTSASIGTTYYYWVKAKNSYGTSGYSSYNTGYRAGTAPSPPTNIQATDGTYTDKVRITWSASSGATSYEVYRATSSGGTKSKIGTPSGTSYDDTSASIGTTYYYWVKAKNSYGTSGYSSYNTGYRAGTAPSPPTNVQATDGTYTDKVRITWSASSGATSYEVYRAASSGGTKNKIGAPSGTSYDDTSASIGTTYYYWVKAKNSYGTSEFSSHDTGYRVTCTYSISPTSKHFSKDGGSSSVSVTTQSGCSWSAGSNAGWVTITSGSSGNGNGTVSYSVSSNSSASQRTGTMTIAGKTFTVTQDGVSCTYSILPTSKSFTSIGGTGSVSVTAPSECSWSATSNDGWITITSGSSGSGNGTVYYSVSSNSSASSRTGTMTIAGKTFTVTQSGVSCTYSILPTSQSFNSSGGTGSVSVTTESGCDWTATSNDVWITLTSGSSGSGNGTVSYSVSSNSSTGSRTGTMTIAGNTFTVTQDVGDIDNCYVNKDDFTCGGNSPCYSSIQEAIDAAGPVCIIKVVQGFYDEDVTLNTSKTLALQGGWDSTFTTQSSNTTINSLTISSGTILPSNLILQPAGATSSSSIRFYEDFLDRRPEPGTIENVILDFIAENIDTIGDGSCKDFISDSGYIESVRNLITHFYKTILGREPESWAVEAWEHGYFNHLFFLNTDVHYVAREMGRLFFLSEEYELRNRSNAEFIDDCSQAFLNQSVNEMEQEDWICSAMEREEVVATFANSDGFAKYIDSLFH